MNQTDPNATFAHISPLERWPEIQAVLIDAMNRLQKALRPYLREVR